MTELMPSLCNDCVARNQCGNDDVKMCISYTKETKIKCDDCKFVENCVDYGWQECKKFTPKPSEPMTNEEWFANLTTEEKADKLTDFSFWLVPTIPTEDKREQVRKRIENWLKEKHE